MSSYLRIYLVPKKTRKKYDWDNRTENGPVEIEEKISEGIPMLFMSTNAGSGIGRVLYENLNIKYYRNDEKEEQYSEVTLEDAERVVDSVKEDVESTENWLKNRTAAFNAIENPNKEAIDYYMSEYAPMNGYLQEQKKMLSYVEALRDMIANMDYGDFEQKFLMNID